MRAAVVLSFLTFATAVHAATVELPQLGSKRRVVMSEMRLAGLSLVDASGSHLDFLGGVSGLEEATSTSFHFDKLSLDEIRLRFPRRQNRNAAIELYRLIHRRLSQQYGRPTTDGLGRSRKSGAPLVSSWEQGDTLLTLRGDRYHDLTLVVRHGRSQPAPVARTAERTSEDHDDLGPPPPELRERLTRAKRATEDLLFELDKQKFMTWARQRKPGPITVRLRRVTVPAGTGLDREVFNTRFDYFVRGSIDLEMVDDHPDLDVEILVRRAPRNELEVLLLARATRGRAKNRVLFSQAQSIN